MNYAILTNLGEGGSPFQKPKTAPTAPGNPLRVSPEATLVAFENQPDSVFARGDAAAYGKIMWSVTKQILHADDIPDAEVFSSCNDFRVWLSRRDRE